MNERGISFWHEDTVMVMMLCRERERRICRGKQEGKQQSKFAHETSSDRYGSSPLLPPVIERAYSGQDNVCEVSKSCTNTLRDFEILTDH